MVFLMAAGGNITDVERYKEGVFLREEEGTTGIGEGMAGIVLLKKPLTDQTK